MDVMVSSKVHGRRCSKSWLQELDQILMAQMGGTSTTVERLTTALCLGHGEKLLRGNNANTLEKNGMAMGAIERHSGTTRSPATCGLAKPLNS
jgi:hypothetical protein